jgi:hypothetical protein
MPAAKPSRLYSVAVKLHHRSETSPDWSSALAAIPGLEVIAADSPHALTVRSTPEALRELKRRLGALCRIEPLARYSPR